MEFDPQYTTYRKLLDMFWQNHDSTVCHKRQYMSAIFYHNDAQRKEAELTRNEYQREQRRPIATKILPAQTFYDAENYHQKYLIRNAPEILASLGLSNEELKSSYAATRLNGYLGGYSTLSGFDAEVKKLGLDEEQAEAVRKIIAHRSK